MPFIHTRVNKPVTPAQEEQMARDMGKAITLLGKSEQWLMLHFEENCRLYFRGGNDQALAFINVKLLGTSGRPRYNDLTQELTRIVSDALDISPDGVYVAYDETDFWGWNGANF